MREARILLLAVVYLIVGPAAARKYYADHPAFITSTARSGVSSSSSSSFPNRDAAWKCDALDALPRGQRHSSRLRPRCQGREHRPTFSTPRRRRRRQTRSSVVVVASSSGLQEPVERVTAATADTEHGEGVARPSWSLRQPHPPTATKLAADERQQHRRAGRSARDSYGRGGIATAAAAAAAAAATAGAVVAVDGCTARNIYAAQGEDAEEGAAGRLGYGASSASAMAKEESDRTAAGYGFEFEDEEDVDIYLPGGMGAGLRPGFKPRKSKPPAKWSKAVSGSSRFRVVLAGREDLDEAGALCIRVFFGQPDSPWKAAQLRQLTREQGQDLESRCNRKESVMFKAIDARRNNAMVGFVEVSETSGSKYGMGRGVPIADTRPVVSNLAVDPLARRFGIGTALMDACEDLVKTWQFEEIILQVEEDNEAALAFYNGLGFNTLFVDRAARRYDTSGFLLQNVRTSKLTMRKPLESGASGEPGGKPGDSFGEQVAHLLRFLAEPFAVRPPPSTRLPARSAASVENLFGSAGGGVGGGGGAGVRRKSSGTGGRVGSSRSRSSMGARSSGDSASSGSSDRSSVASSRRLYSGSSSSSLSSASSSSSSSEEVAPVRLHRKTRRR